MLRLTTFGGLALSSDGNPLAGAAAQRSRLSLLALLATAGATGFSRDKLLLHLWPESDEERARHALKQAVYSLRRELGTDDVIVGTASLSLNPAIVTSDVRDFEAALAAGDLAAAVSIYAGPFLDGFHLKDSVEFERWSGEQRAHYAHQWANAVERLASDFEARGAWREAAGYWRKLAAAEPLSGRLTGALIRCLAESGDVGAALAQFRIHDALLRDELGTAPDADVAKLAEAIRSGAWQRSPEKAAERIPSPPSAAAAATLAAAEPPVSALPAAPIPRTPAGAPGPRRRTRSTAVAFVLGMLVVLVAALSISYANLDPETRASLTTLRTRGPSKLHPRRIVVAPFENRTGDSAIDALGEKTADWFARELSEANFEVVDARTARINTKVVEGIPKMLRAHDRNIALGEETGAGYVVVGNYYREADSLEATVSVVDVATRQAIKSLGPYYGSRRSDDALIKRLLLPTIGFLYKAVDTTAGGMTASNSSPPSLEAFQRVSRAWERFFESPADTAPVFAELDTAARIDTTYATPLLMKAYVLDVKSQWPGVERIVKRVRPLTPKLSRLERAALDLFEADLRGDAFARLEISNRLKSLSPGSAEMPLLVVVSALYAGVPSRAAAALAETDPDRGMNLISPAYWEWRAEAEHESGLFTAEETSAETGLRRFATHPASTYTMVRVLAARNDKRLRELVERGIPQSKSPSSEPRDVAADRQDLMILAGQELRAHGYAATADSFFMRAAKELSTLPAGVAREAQIRQANAYYEAKDYAKARVAFAALVASDTTDIESEGREAVAAARLGDSATAHRIDGHLAGMRRPYMMGRNLRWRADIAAVEGRTDAAADLLERAVRQGHRMMDTPTNLAVHIDGDFDALRKTRAYAAMMQSLSAGR